MDKISRILPSSARVVAAEVAESQPVRPGAPSFGRPEGRNSLGDRITLSKKALESQLSGEVPKADVPLTYKNNSESAKIKVIEKMSQDFFNPKIEAKGNELTTSEDLVKSMNDNDELSLPAIAKMPTAPTQSHVLQEI